MLKTNLFSGEHLRKAKELQQFLRSNCIDIYIFCEQIYNDKLSISSDMLYYIAYPSNIKMVVEYWAHSNNINFL